MADMSSRSWDSDTQGSALRGVLTGLMPLLSVLVFGLALLLTAGVRGATASQGFFAQQKYAVIVLAAGLVLAGITYAVFCARALRRARDWLVDGSDRAALATYWSLGVTALLVLLPVLLAIALPQHPAP
ncbi:MAG TPA: hypothetical protein VGR57_17775 [Ktedonobacterales bacterium]|nr:hypothetical protein [Ktedonobacterales bacterium]